MALTLGYDGRVKSLNRASNKAVAVLGFVLLFAAASLAQINAAPPSVTSMGFGGRAFNGAPPSVTSLGPRGYTPGFNPAYPNSRPVFGPNQGTHHHYHGYVPLGASVYAVPIYGYGYADQPEDANNSVPDDQYSGGPTIFDRRGAGAASRAPADTYAQTELAPVASDPPDPPPADQPETVLVFKDGHRQEVENYAIVGSTLYDLTGGTRHKIALSDLDLDATAKANDDRGIDFALPPGAM